MVSPHRAVAYADDSYIVITGTSPSDLEENFKSTLNRHMNWLSRIGMVCNVSKTEIMVLGDQKIKITIEGSEIESKENLKVLGMTLDSKLSWNTHVEHTVGKCRSFLYGLRYLRKHLSIKEIAKILKAQIVSVITYGAPVWYHRINYAERLKLRSVYYHIIRVMVRDFQLRLNRSGLLRASGMEDLDIIMQKRTSCFVFKILHFMNPTNLISTFISKSYSNDRAPDKLVFFDTSRSKMGKACISNNLCKIVSGWNFQWLSNTPDQFKTLLSAQFQTAH